MLITTYLSMRAPVFVAPAMDMDLYAHPTTQANLQKLQAYGAHLIEPATGYLASDLEGKGRMEEPDRIRDVLAAFFAEGGRLAGKKILITAGPTREKIDPVRFISNYSSGKMGYALAEAAAAQGAEVCLISGPVALEPVSQKIRRVGVESAMEMYEAALEWFPQMDAAILCAAVADYRPTVCAEEKLRRQGNERVMLALMANPDIAAALGKRKRPGQTVVGFALETTADVARALEKLREKRLDYIVLNSLGDAGAGFQGDTNRVKLIDARGVETDFPLKTKSEVARDIINATML
jgi:phosphopantothenoylcysteine decarboxylase/phosphopantothenate--cysteine ligase